MIRVYADIVGDLFHHGHVEFLRRARALGDVLVVGVHSDETVAGYKRRPVMAMDERIRVIEACRYVDELLPDAPVIADEAWIRRHNLDLVVHGDDYDREALAQWYGPSLEMGILRVLPYTPSISTSEIVRRIEQRLIGPGRVEK